MLTATSNKAERTYSYRARSQDGEIVTGTLRCIESSVDYPIEDGIPNMLPPDMRDD